MLLPFQRIRGAAAGALLVLSAGEAWAARLSVVVDGASPRALRIAERLRARLEGAHAVRVHDLRDVRFSDPVAKGRFLARVSDADILVPVGDSAVRLVSHELEDLRSFFVSAAVLRGDYLVQPHVGGVLSYSPEETLRVAKALFPRLKEVGILYTPGYEGVMLRMQDVADRMELSATAYRVDARRDVGPLARQAASRADLLWVAGDPLLAQDPAFSHILQESLLLKKPLTVPVPALVDRGVFFCTLPDEEKISALASSALGRWLSAPAAQPAGQRVLPGPPGAAVVNRTLAEKWDVRVPASLAVWDGARH